MVCRIKFIVLNETNPQAKQIKMNNPYKKTRHYLPKYTVILPIINVHDTQETYPVSSRESQEQVNNYC